MKGFWLATILALSVVTALPSAHAQSSSRQRHLGLGVVLGEPIGGTAKYWIDNLHAADLRVGYSFSEVFDVSLDYTLNFPGVLGNTSKIGGELAPYFGGGVVFLVSTEDRGTRNNQFFDPQDNGSDVGMGLRLPIGIEWLSSEYNVGLFAEIAPGLQLFPNFGGFLQGGLGGRFYF